MLMTEIIILLLLRHTMIWSRKNNTQLQREIESQQLRGATQKHKSSKRCRDACCLWSIQSGTGIQPCFTLQSHLEKIVKTTATFRGSLLWYKWLSFYLKWLIDLSSCRVTQLNTTGAIATHYTRSCFCFNQIDLLGVTTELVDVVAVLVLKSSQCRCSLLAAAVLGSTCSHRYCRLCDLVMNELIIHTVKHPHNWESTQLSIRFYCKDVNGIV